MGDIIVPLWAEKLINGWLGARRAAIVALVRRIEAGTQKPPQPYKARAAKAGAAKAETARKVAGIRMPHFRGWLFAVGRELSLPGIQLGTLLNEDMRAMVCAHPRLARLIRPLLRAMGETVPAWFPRAPTRARAKRTARPAWRTAEAGGGRDADPAWDLVRFIEAARLREYVAGMERLYPGWTRGQAAGQAQLPPVPRPVPFVRAQARAPVPEVGPAPGPAPAPVPAPVSAEPALDRDRYYYAETWNGKLIPVRRRWG
jgi:hypothetical protein